MWTSADFPEAAGRPRMPALVVGPCQQPRFGGWYSERRRRRASLGTVQAHHLVRLACKTSQAGGAGGGASADGPQQSAALNGRAGAPPELKGS
jgi:hypothetical protein